MDEPEMITIRKADYDALIESANFLSCLEQAGVDNWCGYDFAREICREQFPEDSDD